MRVTTTRCSNDSNVGHFTALFIGGIKPSELIGVQRPNKRRDSQMVRRRPYGDIEIFEKNMNLIRYFEPPVGRVTINTEGLVQFLAERFGDDLDAWGRNSIDLGGPNTCVIFRQ